MPGDPNKLLALGEELVGLAHAMTGQGSVSFKEEEFGSAAVILGLYAKSVKTFQATHTLCKAGFGEDAQSLLRCLAEILADIRHIRKENSEKLAEEYIHYTSMQYLKLLNATEKNPGLKGLFSDNEREIIHTRAEKARRAMGEEEFERRYRKGTWHGRGIEEVFHSVDLQSLYDLPFRQGSASIHATDIFDHFEIGESREFVLKMLPGDKWNVPVLSASSLTFIYIMTEVDEVSNFKSKELIGEKLEKFNGITGLK